MHNVQNITQNYSTYKEPREIEHILKTMQWIQILQLADIKLLACIITIFNEIKCFHDERINRKSQQRNKHTQKVILELKNTISRII